VSFEATNVLVLDTTPQANPVANVTVKILSADGTIVYGLATTDSSGHAGFLLPSDVPMQLRCFKFAVSFINPQLFTVISGQTNSFNVQAVLVTPPVPNDPRLCTAYGYFRDITGAPQANADIYFIAEFNPVWVDGAAVLKERVQVRSDKNGYAEVNLFRFGHYRCTVAGEEDITRKIRVPNLPNCSLPDLIFPIVSQAVTTPPGSSFQISVGQELMIGLNLYASDGECLGTAIGDVLYSTSDQSVLSYNVYKAGMTLIGVGPGTATINIVRGDKSIVHLPDPGITGQPIFVVVTP
jgi:hypothetical protein